MELEFHHYLIAIIGGGLAGIVNTLAGNGSAITLTILTEVLGLPANIANGTNRIGVLGQSWVATATFYHNGKLNWPRSRLYTILTVIGALAGVLVAVWVSNERFIKIFRYLMIFMLFVILVKPKRWLKKTDQSIKPKLWIVIPAFLAIGFYGGFIQMGMGVFFLGIMVLGAKWSLLDSNVIKSLIVAVYTILALAIFQWNGLLDWKIGFILASGQMSGAWFAATFASKYEAANIWAHRLLIVVVVLAIVKLFNLQTLIF